MANLIVAQEFQLSLNIKEMRLILTALGGRLKEEDVVAAKNLGDALSIIKAKIGIHNNHENEKLISSLKKAGLEI